MKQFIWFLAALPFLGGLLAILHYFRHFITTTVFFVTFGVGYTVWYMCGGMSNKHGTHREDS